jgi:hypothetical protein
MLTGESGNLDRWDEERDNKPDDTQDQAEFAE